MAWCVRVRALLRSARAPAQHKHRGKLTCASLPAVLEGVAGPIAIHCAYHEWEVCVSMPITCRHARAHRPHTSARARPTQFCAHAPPPLKQDKDEALAFINQQLGPDVAETATTRQKFPYTLNPKP